MKRQLSRRTFAPESRLRNSPPGLMRSDTVSGWPKALMLAVALNKSISVAFMRSS
jgi:hypothetical protein